MVKFHQTSTEEFELVTNDIYYLFEQFAQIQQFISSNFPSEYHGLLAKPERRGKVLEWYTSLDGSFKKLESFPKETQARILGVYNARRYEIDRKCLSLAHSEDFDHQIWASILRSTFNPDHLQIFSNGNDLQLVWGIRTMRKKDYEIPYDLFKSLIIPVPSAAADVIDLPAGPQTGDVEQHIEENTQQADAPVEDESAVSSENPEPEIIPEPVERPTVATASGGGNNRIPPPKHWFYAMLDRFEVFAKRFWWLLLLLFLLLVLLLFSFFSDSAHSPGIERGVNNPLTETELEEEFRSIMPVDPGARIPIDTNRFEEDDETGAIYISGLVNIAMVDSVGKFKRMAVDLKKSFPDEQYRIVYYDTNTHRLQMEFPPETEPDFKAKVREKLSAYKLLIWDESVFRTSIAVNDPFLNDAEKSWHLKAIKAPQAWDYTIGDTSIVIAIVDDGFDLSHDEFRGNRIVHPYNVRNRNDRVYGNARIMHGTHVAALALGNIRNGFGGSGVAPACSFMPVQIGSDVPYFAMTDVVDGILYALNHGADVINLSLGQYFGAALHGFSPSEMQEIIDREGKDEEAFWKDLFQLAEEKNASIVVAAGNEDLLIGLDPMQRSDVAVKVVAVDQGLRKTSFSNYCQSCTGKTTYISAPGKDIISALPGNRFKAEDGTSMAAPLVTGAIALMKAYRPDLKNQEILRILHETAFITTDRSIPPVVQVDKALARAKR